MSSDGPAPSSSETLNKVTGIPHTNSTTSTLDSLAMHQANEMLVTAPSTSITTHGTTSGKSASAPSLMSHVTDLFSSEASRYSITDTSTSNSNCNILRFGINADSFLTNSTISVLTYNLASISPLSTDISSVSLTSTAALETYVQPVNPSILSDTSVKDVIENSLLSSNTTDIAKAKLENTEMETDETDNECKPRTDLDYADASTSTPHIVLTEAATDPIDFESNSTVGITETTITSKLAATNLTITPIVNIIAIESSAYEGKTPAYGISKEMLVTDLTESSSTRIMDIPIKTSTEKSTETATPETISLDKQPVTNIPAATNLANKSATNIATHLLLSILSKVTPKRNVETIPATNIPINCIATKIENFESNNHPAAILTFNEDVASFSQSATSAEISNRVDYSKATEYAENGAGKQVRFTNSTVSANSNVKYY